MGEVAEKRTHDARGQIVLVNRGNVGLGGLFVLGGEIQGVISVYTAPPGVPCLPAGVVEFAATCTVTLNLSSAISRLGCGVARTEIVSVVEAAAGHS